MRLLFLKRVLPLSLVERLRALRYGPAHTPLVGYVQFGSLRRLTPVSRTWGFERGGPIDRYYIERCLSAHQEDIRGAVLEIGDDRYTQEFGTGRVTRSEVLDVNENPNGQDTRASPSLPGPAGPIAVTPSWSRGDGPGPLHALGCARLSA